MKKYKIVGFPNPSAASYWRIKDPFNYLAKLGHECVVSDSGITQELAEQADVYVLQGIVDMDGIATLYEQQQEHGKKIIVDCDDWMEVPDDNPHKKEHEVSNAIEIIKKTMEIADLVTTTNENLSKELREINPNVRVIPNFIDLDRFGGERFEENNRLKIGWMGSMTHYKDLELVAPAIKEILDKYPVDFVMMGDPRLKNLFPDHNVECQLGVPFEYYPQKLRSLRIDIGICPLVDTVFNRAKSNIKAMEFGSLKIPVVASKVSPYQDLEGVIPLVNPEEWFKAIELLILSREYRKDVARSLSNWTIKHALHNNYNKWQNAIDSL